MAFPNHSLIRVKRFRPGRVRGIAAARLAASVAAATTDAEGVEHDTLSRLAARAAELASRSRGERGWSR
jgi:hypothetical protein